MITRDDVPETPEWVLPPRDEKPEALTIPPNIELGGRGD
jgi:hypothetical protein